MSFIKKIGLIVILSLFACTAVSGDDSMDDLVKVKINDNVFDVKLENNSATQELIKKLEKGNVTVNAKEFGGFEKVGDLGFSLPTNDENMKTGPGDIVLYQGNQISLFYGSHSWSYTKLGKLDNVDSNKLKEVLGSGDVTLEFSLK
ncbi:cyclophilin-like fold protein [uncultured Methanobrevibacter sp.]|uniref:cyclophilin-like fold protein n=1 Tax=uncultured Methanobrevibacter sp. TaxID=253161 RepID=UPI0025E08A63|nr:cyclophilin-like fold protein [uncultured Methanobrevibacter sp.]